MGSLRASQAVGWEGLVLLPGLLAIWRGWMVLDGFVFAPWLSLSRHGLQHIFCDVRMCSLFASNAPVGSTNKPAN